MVNEDLINMDGDMNKFGVSWYTSRVADIGTKQVISSWNNHALPFWGSITILGHISKFFFKI